MVKKLVIVLLIILAVVLLVGVNYIFFSGSVGLPANVKEALKSDEHVEISLPQNGDWLVATPKKDTPQVGLVLYPEGNMDVRTYAYISREIAKEGYLVVFISRRADRDLDLEKEYARIEEVVAAFPEIETWVAGGHTWSGHISPGYALRHPGQFQGLVLWAARLGDESSLAASQLPVLYIYGSLDDENVNLVESVEPYVPAHTQWVVIEGGNRVGFASFGPMAADAGAKISEAEQQAQAAAATVEFLKTLAK
jgi:dienelactone hydrolase